MDEREAYTREAMAHATIEPVGEGYMGRVKGLVGVIEFGPTPDACRMLLEEVIEGWALLYSEQHPGLPLPKPWER